MTSEAMMQLPSGETPLNRVTGRRMKTLCEAEAWRLLLGLRQSLQGHGTIAKAERVGIRWSPTSETAVVPADAGDIVVSVDAPRGWRPGRADITQAGAAVLDLFVPLLVGPRADSYVVAHLAQSLDGKVATTGGKSQFISAHDDLLHTHRLRALFDAVVVGASTVEHDNPRLTTRMCDGPSPMRVVLDPRGRLCEKFRLFEDSRPSLVIRGSKSPASNREKTMGNATIVEVPFDERDQLDVRDILNALRARGLPRIFIEGGGVTVSKFLKAGVLDRLHVAVAPMIIGSGRPGLALPNIEDLNQALRFRCRHFSLGPDILFDCALTRT